MMIVQVGSMILGCVRTLICLFLISEILHLERPGRKGIIAAIIAGVVLETILLVINGETAFIQYGGEAVVAVLVAERFQKGPRKMCLFISIYSMIALALGEFIAGVIMATVLKDERFLQRDSVQGSLMGWIPAVLAILVGVLLVKGTFEKVDKSQIAKGMVMIMFLFVISILSLAEKNTISIPLESVITWAILGMNLIFGFFAFNMTKQYNLEKKLAELNAQQAALLEKDYTDLNQAYAVNAKLFHDFHNHIGMIRQLVTSEKYGDAVAYLDELQAPIREMTNAKWTGEQTIDYLINEKLAVAAEHGIDMTVEVEYPNHSNLKSVDMCAIIGNLLDNALEAAKQVSQEEQRYIHFVIRRIHQMLVIKVENSFEKNVLQENGELKTTKKEGGLHGWGMKSVKTAVDKYEGTVQHSQEGKNFMVVATLSFEGIQSMSGS